MAYKSKKPEQNPNKPTEEEIKKAAHDMAVFLYDLYQAEKTKKSKK